MNNSKSIRYHSIDALRGFAMLLGVLFHASISYSLTPGNSVWISDSSYQSIIFDFLYTFSQSFRMQLFFLIAGFFARLLFLKVGVVEFAKRRLHRILLPFMLGMVLIIPFSIAPFIYYKDFFHNHLSHNECWNNVYSYFIKFYTFRAFYPTAHLWFLYYLLIYYIGIIFLKYLSAPALSRALNKIAKLFEYRTFLPLGIPVIIVLTFLSLFLYKSLNIEVTVGLFPQISTLLYYGLFFIFGWIIHRNIPLLEIIKKYSLHFFLAGIVLLAPVFYIIENFSTDIDELSTFELAGFRFLFASQTIFLVLGFLGVFLRFFEFESKTARYISDASYWIYLIHLPLITIMQLALQFTPVPGVLRFWMILCISTSFLLITYHLFVRYTIIGETLHGKRVK